ncbi:glycosyltransferase [Pseudomonas wayambapalatensis]|nr:glycosyltransferase [Pseudomonas wayambapalatensis]
MKVLLAHKYHSLKGGAEVFYFEVANCLKRHGHEVAFFSTESDENLQGNDPLFVVPEPQYLSGRLMTRLAAAKDIFYSVHNRKAMLAAIDAFKPDLIHAFAIHVHLTPAILEAAKERGIPVIMSCNDYKHICPNYKLHDGKALCESCKGGRFYNAALKRCSKNSLIFSVASALEAYIHRISKVYDRLVDKYLFSSVFMLEKTREFWPGKAFRAGILKNPFDVGAFQPVYTGDYALYFGRVIEEKGVDRIIEAVEKLSIPVKIVGDGPDLAHLKALCEHKHLTHVEFLGPLWGDALKPVLEGARFILVPSLWHENFPYVIFQAFAAGKPVIGSLRGGIPELISAERGLLFEPDDPHALAACMKQLWNDAPLCTRLGINAREYVESEFSDQVFYETLMRHYNEVLS